MGRNRITLPAPDRIKRHHTGRARIWYSPPFGRGQWHYLGPWDDDTDKPSELAIAKYWKLVESIRRDSGGPAIRSTDWLMAEMLAEWYGGVKAKLSPKERHRAEKCVDRLVTRYVDVTVREFGPSELSDWQRWMGETLTRSTIAKERRVLFGAFRWAFTRDRVRVGETRWAELQLVKPPRTDECRPAGKVLPVDWGVVEATLAHLRPTVAAMVRLQWETGMRPGELFVMRARDIHKSSRVNLPSGAIVDVDAVNRGQKVKLWLYVVPGHKTAHHGIDRYIWLGPGCQKILKPFLARDVDALLFTPRQSIAEWREEQRCGRRTKVQPSQVSRAKGSPRKRAGDGWVDSGYRQAIMRACEMAGVPGWNPYQLRHAALSRIRDAAGIGAAALVAGHRDTRVTEGYTRTAAEAGRAADVARLPAAV